MSIESCETINTPLFFIVIKKSEFNLRMQLTENTITPTCFGGSFLLQPYHDTSTQPQSNYQRGKWKVS